jgi:DNA-binding GntR family transcriptional regulator
MERSGSRNDTPAKAVTNVGRAYGFLRQMAIEFDLKPGERLNEVEIARQLHMSRAPVREAMNRLVSEGLLTVVPNQGFSCRRLSASEILELFEVRADLETAALAVIPPAALTPALAGLRQLTLSIRNEFGSTDLGILADRDEEFHLRLAAMAGNAERVGILKHINARIRFVRRIRLGEPAWLSSLEEHLPIIDALEAGDIPAATQILRRHLTLRTAEAAEVVSRGLHQIYASATT